jgi:hypothetical protein
VASKRLRFQIDVYPTKRGQTIKWRGSGQIGNLYLARVHGQVHTTLTLTTTEVLYIQAIIAIVGPLLVLV